MKTNFLSLCTMCGLALLPMTTFADQDRGVYFSADVGGTILESMRLKEAPGATPGGKVEFDPGARVSFMAAYRFNQWLSLGAEMGFAANDIKHTDATFSQAPVFANVEFRLPNDTPLVPFIGGGPGFSVNTLTIDDDVLGDGTEVDGYDSDVVFAWQAYAGVRYKISDNMSLGLVYKYLNAGTSTWHVHNAAEDIRFDRVDLHTISASFAFEF